MQIWGLPWVHSDSLRIYEVDQLNDVKRICEL